MNSVFEEFRGVVRAGQHDLELVLGRVGLVHSQRCSNGTVRARRRQKLRLHPFRRAAHVAARAVVFVFDRRKPRLRRLDHNHQRLGVLAASVRLQVDAKPGNRSGRLSTASALRVPVRRLSLRRREFAAPPLDDRQPLVGIFLFVPSAGAGLRDVLDEHRRLLSLLSALRFSGTGAARPTLHCRLAVEFCRLPPTCRGWRFSMPIS